MVLNSLLLQLAIRLFQFSREETRATTNNTDPVKHIMRDKEIKIIRIQLNT
jgi:hypothetical protein